MKYILFSLLFFVISAHAQYVNIVEQGQPCSIRGLSVVNNQVAWVSGSKGHVSLSTNGGQTWKWQQVKGFEQSDFRDIEAFSEKEAIIMSSGTPALILKTVDGGLNWQVCYRNNDKAYFLDAIAFTPDGKFGYALGDPIDIKFLILETNDSGKTWKQFANLPTALPGEAAFAASGTCLQIIQSNHSLAIVTGGSTSRFIYYISKGWISKDLPIAHGLSSQGAFSFTSNSESDQIMVSGGDYSNPDKPDSIACYLQVLPNKPLTLRSLKNQPSGYQSCIITYKNASTYLSTGTSGTNITTNGGESWKRIDTTSFNVCQRAKHGNLLLLAGDKGKIAIFKNQ